MNRIELIKLDSVNDKNDYYKAFESYTKIYNMIMSTGNYKKTPSFLGGNPLNMENKDIANMLNSKYVVSAKADGYRFLLMVGEKVESGKRCMYLVDKNLDFWTILDNNRVYVNEIDGVSPMLIDGELVMWGSLEISDRIMRLNRHGSHNPFMLFSAFDMLYGPSDPKISNVDYGVKMDLGSSFAMMGPKGGSRWPWNKRYSILDIVINNVYSNFNSYNNNLMIYNIKFGIILSPFKKLDEVLQNLKVINLENMSNYMKSLYIENIRTKYDKLVNFSSEGNTKNGFNTDGIIFTPYSKEYVKGSWNFCGSKTFKLKPPNELTVDLMIGKKTENGNIGLASLRSGNVSAGLITGNRIKEGTIVECILEKIENGTRIFSVKKIRTDKIRPNSINTVNSVISSIENPVNVSFLNILTQNKAKVLKKLDSNTLVNIIGKNRATRCMLENNPDMIFNENIKKSIIELLVQHKNSVNTEIEARIILKNNGNSYFNCLLGKIFENRGNIHDSPFTLKHYNRDGTRKTFVVLGSYKILESFEHKKQINKISIVGDSIYDYKAINFVVSKEELAEDNGKQKTILHRYEKRYRLNGLYTNNIPSSLWRVDISEYGESKSSDEDAVDDYYQNPKISLEIEYAPGDSEMDMWNRYFITKDRVDFDKLVTMFGLNRGVPEKEILRLINMRISKMKNFNSEYVYRDFCKLLIWLLEKLN